MNYKYFGNSLDLFKYDVLSYLCKNNELGLFYNSMLTEPESKKKDPKYDLFEVGSKNRELFDFLRDASKFDLDFSEINNFLNKNICNHRIILEKKIDLNSCFIKDIKYFTEDVRKEYFSESMKEYKKWRKSNSILFIDPDVGLDLGISRRVRSNRKMYLYTEEINQIRKEIIENDIICYFQHLGNPRYSLEKRYIDLIENFGNNILIFAYERISVALIFIIKNNVIMNKIKDDLKKYKSDYEYLEHSNRIKLI